MGIQFSNGFSISKNTAAVVADAIRAQLSGASLTNYDAASVGNWVKVSQTEYDAVVANVSGATKKGNSDSDINKRDVAVGYSSYWISFGSSGTPSFQIDNGEYVIALISEAWNANTGQTQLGYTTTFNGSSIINIGGTAGTSTGGGRDYYVRKAPTDAATETRYPVMKMTVGPNAVNGWSGYYSSNNGTSWTSAPNGTVSKIQIVTTSTKSW